MAQYVTKTTTIEAYQLGTPNPPAWIEKAIEEDRLFPIRQSNLAIVQWRIANKVGPSQYVPLNTFLILSDPHDTLTPMTPDLFNELYNYDNADLVSVLGKTGLNIDVANSVSTVALSNIVVGTSATKKLFTDATLDTEITGATTVPLTAGTAVTVYIQVTSSAGTNVVVYPVKILRAAA